ncbi:MAG: hypothetical protein JNJ85_07900 [Candidatus Kapabacteria bacterium]|nr:hypothetical protein [Candidatus Kapabacteria bacterium]
MKLFLCICTFVFLIISYSQVEARDKRDSMSYYVLTFETYGWTNRPLIIRNPDSTSDTMYASDRRLTEEKYYDSSYSRIHIGQVSNDTFTVINTKLVLQGMRLIDTTVFLLCSQGNQPGSIPLVWDSLRTIYTCSLTELVHGNLKITDTIAVDVTETNFFSSDRFIYFRNCFTFSKVSKTHRKTYGLITNNKGRFTAIRYYANNINKYRNQQSGVITTAVFQKEIKDQLRDSLHVDSLVVISNPYDNSILYCNYYRDDDIYSLIVSFDKKRLVLTPVGSDTLLNELKLQNESYVYKEESSVVSNVADGMVCVKDDYLVSDSDSSRAELISRMMKSKEFGRYSSTFFITDSSLSMVNIKTGTVTAFRTGSIPNFNSHFILFKY